jgi:hypothetical protein
MEKGLAALLRLGKELQKVGVNSCNSSQPSWCCRARMLLFEWVVLLLPAVVVCRVELGRTHLRLGHKRDAYQHLLASMDCEVEDINAKLQKDDAELLLAKLQAELKGRTELPASWGGFTAPGIAAVDDSSSSSTTSSCKVEEVEVDAGSSGSSGGVAGGDAAA